MNLEFIANFIQTANHQSIAKASESLNISHPALGKQIRKLEAYYGTKLFNRSASGVQLTEAGQVLYDKLSRVMGELASIRAEMEAFRDLEGMDAELRLGTLPSLAAYYMPNRLVAMERGGILIRLVVHNTSERLLRDVLAGELNAAVIDGHRHSHLVWSRTLFREAYYVIVPNHHRLRHESCVTIQDIASEPFVTYPKACSIRKWLNERLASIQSDPASIQTEIPFGDYIPGYVAAGAGIAVVPQMTARHLGHPTLTAIPIADPKASRTVTLIAASVAIGKRLYPQLKS